MTLIELLRKGSKEELFCLTWEYTHVAQDRDGTLTAFKTDNIEFYKMYGCWDSEEQSLMFCCSHEVASDHETAIVSLVDVINSMEENANLVESEAQKERFNNFMNSEEFVETLKESFKNMEKQ